MAAQRAGIAACAINRTLPDRQNDLRYADHVRNSGTNRVSLTIDGLSGFGGVSREICHQRFNIAFPLWELEQIPKRRQKNLRKFDDIWAPSAFIRKNLECALGRPVRLMPHPIEFPRLEPFHAESTGPLRLLFLFDFDSFSARKNPEAVVRAFQAAFPGNEDVRLTIKTRGLQDRGRRIWLTSQAERDSRIVILDKTLPYDGITALLRSHDVFLSLHRSEGFGLGCAEALALEKIVVATNYGGTSDFITETTGFPVSWRPHAVAEGDYVESDGAVWAEPSIEHAAYQLRQIYDAPHAARNRAIIGRRLLMKRHSLDVVGEQMYEALYGTSKRPSIQPPNRSH
jgi:glycosyltransferase involved in cell wall biosynthesis